MNAIKNDMQPPDHFICKMQKMKFKEFECDYEDDEIDRKQMRNDYDNRMRPNNLILYWVFEKMNPKTRNASTQTKLDVRGNLI